MYLSDLSTYPTKFYNCLFHLQLMDIFMSAIIKQGYDTKTLLSLRIYYITVSHINCLLCLFQKKFGYQNIIVDVT